MYIICQRVHTLTRSRIHAMLAMISMQLSPSRILPPRFRIQPSVPRPRYTRLNIGHRCCESKKTIVRCQNKREFPWYTINNGNKGRVLSYLNRIPRFCSSIIYRPNGDTIRLERDFFFISFFSFEYLRRIENNVPRFMIKFIQSTAIFLIQIKLFHFFFNSRNRCMIENKGYICDTYYKKYGR